MKVGDSFKIITKTNLSNIQQHLQRLNIKYLIRTLDKDKQIYRIWKIRNKKIK